MSASAYRVRPTLDVELLAWAWLDSAAVKDKLSTDPRTQAALNAHLANRLSNPSAMRTVLSSEEFQRVMGRVAKGPPFRPYTTDAPSRDTADPFAALHEGSSLDEVGDALELWKARLTASPRAGRALERERAIGAVKKVKAVTSPAKLVDDYIPPPLPPPPRSVALPVADVEPSQEPQSTSGLLGEIVAAFERYLVLPAGAAIVLASWVLHTWVFHVACFTPRIAIKSPTKRCGKSLLLELLQALCARPLMSANLSTAVLYRVIEARKPTLLVDEADSFLHDNEELRGVLNAGFKYDGTVLRCDGEENEPRAFKCFAPVAIAAIGALPVTLVDRALTIAMARKAKGDKVLRFDRRSQADLATLRPRLARWAQDNEEALHEAEPVAPEALNDRQRDISEPLIAIADLAGGEWSARVPEAILAVCGAAGDDSSDKREKLLAAVWDLFRPEVDFLTFESILERLLADEESEWHEAAKGKPLNAVWLGRHLKPFGLTSRQSRSANRERGYFREDLAPVIAKYLAEPGKPPEIPLTPVTAGPNELKRQSKVPEDVTRDSPSVSRVKDLENPSNLARVTGVTGPAPLPLAPDSRKARNGAMVPIPPEEIWTAEELATSRALLEAEEEGRVLELLRVRPSVTGAQLSNLAKLPYPAVQRALDALAVQHLAEATRIDPSTTVWNPS